MSRTTVPSRAISVVLAFALAFTMTPSLAFATNASSSGSASSNAAITQDAENATSENATDAAQVAAANRVDEDVTLDGENSNATSNSAQATEPSQQNETNTQQNSGDNADADSNAPAGIPAQQGAATTTAADDLELVNIQIDLKAQAETAPVLAYNGLNYIVNTDDDTTVTLTGWTGNAPTGTLNIPSQVVNGNTTYAVTKISLGGGGQ